MSDAYVIEVQGNTVGIIVRKHRYEESFRFMSALHAFDCLDGQEFAGPLEAENAAWKLLREMPRSVTHAIFAKS